MPAPLSRPHVPVAPLLPPQGRAVDPQGLWNDLQEARQAVVEERRQSSGRTRNDARDQVLAALEAYASSLTAMHRPIPYALRDELSLLRLTCRADRRY